MVFGIAEDSFLGGASAVSDRNLEEVRGWDDFALYNLLIMRRIKVLDKALAVV